MKILFVVQIKKLRNITKVTKSKLFLANLPSPRTSKRSKTSCFIERVFHERIVVAICSNSFLYSLYIFFLPYPSLCANTFFPRYFYIKKIFIALWNPITLKDEKSSGPEGMAVAAYIPQGWHPSIYLNQTFPQGP